MQVVLYSTCYCFKKYLPNTPLCHDEWLNTEIFPDTQVTMCLCLICNKYGGKKDKGPIHAKSIFTVAKLCKGFNVLYYCSVYRQSLNNCLKNSTQLTTFNVKWCGKIIRLDLYLTFIWTFYAIIPKASFITLIVKGSFVHVRSNYINLEQKQGGPSETKNSFSIWMTMTGRDFDLTHLTKFNQRIRLSVLISGIVLQKNM